MVAARSTEAVLDTSVWVALFHGEPAADRLPDALGDRTAVVTPLVLAELAARHRLGAVRRARPVSEVGRAARLAAFTREDALAGGERFGRLRAKGRRKLSLGDCLIYATARRLGAPLLTCDRDLLGQPGVVVLA